MHSWPIIVDYNFPFSTRLNSATLLAWILNKNETLSNKNNRYLSIHKNKHKILG